MLIREIREKLGLTQEQLAYRLGVSWTTISRWERGVCAPSPMAQRQLQEIIDNLPADQNLTRNPIE